MDEPLNDPLASACDSAAALKWRLAVLADYFAQSDSFRESEAGLAFRQVSEICKRLDALADE